MPHDIGRMFWHGDVPWHGLGKELDRPATLEEALGYGDLDWTVELARLRTDEADCSAVGQRRAIVRSDLSSGSRGRVLGVVHRGFRPLQNREGAELFDRLLPLGERRYHTGGYLGCGQIVWLLARLPMPIVVRDGDEVETYALFTNSHDGSIAIDIRLTTIRVVCRNTLSLALGRVSSRAFHRAHRSSPAVIEREAKALFQATRERIEQTQALFRRLAGVRCCDADFGRFTRRLLPEPKLPGSATPGSPQAKAHATRIATLARHRAALARIRTNGLVERDLAPDDPTWWGAVNAVTGWVDHVQSAQSARYAHAMFGAGDAIKRRALALATAATGSWA